MQTAVELSCLNPLHRCSISKALLELRRDGIRTDRPLRGCLSLTSQELYRRRLSSALDQLTPKIGACLRPSDPLDLKMTLQFSQKDRGECRKKKEDRIAVRKR